MYNFMILGRKLINLNGCICPMGKLSAIMRAIINGQASIDCVEKTRISKAPGDVTDLNHN
jgi:hypothetical protein